MTHSLERTSPKGERFIGRCVQCGKRDLPMSAALEQCQTNTTPEDAVLRAVQGEEKE